MLVMRRRCGEGFSIGDGIEVEVLEVSGTRVKLGIKAPESCIILRKEIKVTRDQNASASRSVDLKLIGSLVDKLSR
jgi:carbon storage regulator